MTRTKKLNLNFKSWKYQETYGKSKIEQKNQKIDKLIV